MADDDAPQAGLGAEIIIVPLQDHHIVASQRVTWYGPTQTGPVLKKALPRSDFPSTVFAFFSPAALLRITETLLLAKAADSSSGAG